MQLPNYIYALISCYARNVDSFILLSPYFDNSFITEVKNEKNVAITYLRNGVPHSVDDEPARYFVTGKKMWYRNGEVTRIEEGRRVDNFLEYMWMKCKLPPKN